jgi:hypothetical protein
VFDIRGTAHVIPGMNFRPLLLIRRLRHRAPAPAPAGPRRGRLAAAAVAVAALVAVASLVAVLAVSGSDATTASALAPPAVARGVPGSATTTTTTAAVPSTTASPPRGVPARPKDPPNGAPSVPPAHRSRPSRVPGPTPPVTAPAVPSATAVSSRPPADPVPVSTRRSPPPHATGPPTLAFAAYTPWRDPGDLAPGTKVLATARGHCSASSKVVAGAFLCQAGSDTYDPCFVPPGPAPHQVACQYAPWTGALVIDLTGPLPAPSSPSPHPPWAFELMDGTVCAAGGAPAGSASYYGCQPGGGAGAVDRSSQPWTVSYSAAGSPQLRTGVLLIAWS